MQNVAAWGGGGGGGGYFINERDTHVCSMTFAYVRIFHRVRYWYGICDVGTIFSRAVSNWGNLRFNSASTKNEGALRNGTGIYILCYIQSKCLLT